MAREIKMEKHQHKILLFNYSNKNVTLKLKKCLKKIARSYKIYNM